MQLLYLFLISVAAVIITVYDKRAAKMHRKRIPEYVLLLVGLMGGALAMFLTMLIIHHKTRHRKFMFGLPIEFLIHGLILAGLFLYNR